jgi:hypothetical protein
MKCYSLQAAYVGATLYAILSLVTAQGAWAHVDVQPRLVVQGATTLLRVELPQLRPGPRPTRLEVEGEGIEVLSTRLRGRAGSETIWSARVRTDASPGPVPLLLRAVYADGKSVEVHDKLTVVPPAASSSSSSSLLWIGAVGGSLLAVALAFAVLRLARRRTG